MSLYKVGLLFISMIAMATNNQLYSQTCRIKTATLNNGGAVYTEVYEYDYVDVKPEFPGDGNSLVSFINATRVYPQEAYENGIQGRVTCSFVVEPDGKVSHIKVLRGVEPSLNKEAVRIISMMPEWVPGKIGEHAVPVRVVCCIPFRK